MPTTLQYPASASNQPNPTESQANRSARRTQGREEKVEMGSGVADGTLRTGTRYSTVHWYICMWMNE